MSFAETDRSANRQTARSRLLHGTFHNRTAPVSSFARRTRFAARRQDGAPKLVTILLTFPHQNRQLRHPTRFASTGQQRQPAIHESPFSTESGCSGGSRKPNSRGNGATSFTSPKHRRYTSPLDKPIKYTQVHHNATRRRLEVRTCRSRKLIRE
jgi:hypothetical protein